MKDVFGSELEVGDTVAFMVPDYLYALRIGTIHKLTEQKVAILIADKNDYQQMYYKFPCQVAKKLTMHVAFSAPLEPVDIKITYDKDIMDGLHGGKKE